MTELVQAIGEYGILVVIAACFLWIVIGDRANNQKRDNKYNESLSLLSKSNDNIASSLALLTRSMDENKDLLTKHDERSIKINENVNLNTLKVDEVKSIVQNCTKLRKE